MTKKVAPSKPVRERLKADLEAKYDKLLEVIENAMDSTKEWPVWCKNCKHRAYAQVPNVADQIKAAEFIANQALGRPGQAEPERDEALVFENKVILVNDDG